MRRSLKVSLFGIIIVAVGLAAANMAAGNEPQLGLDLQGGASVVLEPETEVPNDTLDQAIEIIRSRVDSLGVAEPEIARQGDSIVVQLPGVKDQRRALELVGQTAELQFRPVIQQLPPGGVPPSTSPPAPPSTTTTRRGATTSTTKAPASTTTTNPDQTTTSEGAAGTGYELHRVAQQTPTTATPPPTPKTTTATPPTTAPQLNPAELTPRDELDPKEPAVLAEYDDGREVFRYILGPAEMSGRGVKSASAAFDDQGGQGWIVTLNFTGDGKNQFRAIVDKHVSEPLAIELDGEVKSAPTLQESLRQGDLDEVVISGNFSEGEAKDLERLLRYGALPVQLEQETVQTVSPSLGRDSLRAGLAAGLVGVGLVLLYMILYYRALGLVVVLGLGVWAALMWSVVSYLGESSGLALSLAGVTGIIVSVGVTTDSYVVFFERLKDEVRSGKTIRSSVEKGFVRAFRTILTADFSSFLGAVLLYSLTVGPVRGFAFFLGLSTILDVVVAYFFTRPLVTWLSRSRAFTETRLLGVGRNVVAQGSPA